MHDIFYFIQRGTPVVEACDKTNSQPHIVYFCDVNDDSDDLAAQFFIAIEQKAQIYLLLCFIWLLHTTFSTYHITAR